MNSSFSRSEILYSNEFVEAMRLIDSLVLGGKYTWFKPDGSDMSILYIFLTSEIFLHP